MELSGVELSYLVNEIKSKTIQGYYVSDVIPVTRNSFLFKLHHSTEPDIMLMISTKGIWITNLKFKPLEQNYMGEIIKSHLERSKIETLHQPDSERIVIFNFRHPIRGLRILVVELFADGNIVLCDEKSNILAILKPIEAKHRTLRVGTVYEFPPRRGIDVVTISMDDFVNMSINVESSGLLVVKWVGRITSLPRKFVEEIVFRSNIQAETVENLTLDEIRRIYFNTKSLIEEITTSSKHNPTLIEDEDGNPVDVLPIPTNATANARAIMVKEYMEGVDQVLSYQIINLGRKLKTTHIESRVSALLHDISEQDRAKEQVIAKAHIIRKVAAELMSIPYEGSDIEFHEPFTNLIQEKSVNIFNRKGTRYLEVAGEDIEFQRNPARMSSMLFQRAKDLERGLSSIDEAKTRLVGHINRLRRQADSIEAKGAAVQHVRNKEWYERYRWFITSDGLLAIGGRDASSNSAIIRKHLEEQDLVFHAEIHGSPFFILKNSHSLDNIDRSLQEVGQATVSFSRAWKDGLYGGDAYWVTPAQVKRGAPTGQFLPKGSFVIEGKRNYVKGLEIQLAIGIIERKEDFFLCCGPFQAIKTKSLIYMGLSPGGQDPMNAAKKIKNELVSVLAGKTKQTELSLLHFVKNMSLDDFVRILPTGQSKITNLVREGLDKRIDSPMELKRNGLVEQSN
jgi:predicted ribosome quality control (RQC) complex YloA/Tae2 family protein